MICFFGTQLYCKHSPYEGYFLAQKVFAYIELKNFFPIKFLEQYLDSEI